MASTVGLIVNPVAGLGGRVGLKGSDGDSIQARAHDLGGSAMACSRAAVALTALATEAVEILTIGGAMGEDVCRAQGLAHTVVARFAAPTRGADSTAAAARLVAAGTSLILFAGGDGTARDVAAGAGRTPVLGIPGGVKMYSGVFAANPALAGWLAGRFVTTAPALRATSEVELLDIDEAALRRDEPVTRLHGVAWVPASTAVRRAKAVVPASDDRALEAVCREMAAALDPAAVTIVGPGRTTRLLMTACGLPKTLLGVDAMLGRTLLGRDCGEADLLGLLGGRPAQIVIGLLGAQGCLFGRGNQPISARVIRLVGLENIVILAGAGKVATLTDGLFVDTGDAGLDLALRGYRRVLTGPGQSTILRVRSTEDFSPSLRPT